MDPGRRFPDERPGRFGIVEGDPGNFSLGLDFLESLEAGPDARAFGDDQDPFGLEALDRAPERPGIAGGDVDADDDPPPKAQRPQGAERLGGVGPGDPEQDGFATVPPSRWARRVP